MDKKGIQERFNQQWIPEPNSGCYLWLGSLTIKGFGKFWFNKTCKSAHRVAYFLHHDYWPTADEHVLHTCKTTMCVNPRHLYLGNQNNERKKRSLGKFPFTNQKHHPRQILDADTVSKIKRRLTKNKKADLSSE